MSHLVPTDEPETKLSTLNPVFLQSVLDEATKRRKEEPTGQQVENPFSSFVSEASQPFDRPHPSLPPGGEGSNSTALGSEPAPTPWPLGSGDHCRNDEYKPVSTALPPEDKPTLFSNLAYAKAVLADKRAEIEQTQRQLERLVKIKAVVEPVAMHSTSKTNLNELKLKRLAIQMALVADSTEYNTQDLLAVDKQIAELSSRQPKSPANLVEQMKLNAKIDELRDKVDVLTEELKRQTIDYNLSVAFKKAESYVQTLKAACNLRHELLALVELLANDCLLSDLRLGGELPFPYGFEPFDSMPEDDLATTLEGIEEAKIRISQELIL